MKALPYGVQQMDDYVMDQVIDSFVNDGWGCDYSGGGGRRFNYDSNYYHYNVKFKLVHQTAKAYLLEAKKGEFWCPKALFKSVKIKDDTISGLLWEGFLPSYLAPEPDMKPLVRPIKKKEPKQDTTYRTFKIGVPDTTVYDKEWAINEGLICE